MTRPVVPTPPRWFLSGARRPLTLVRRPDEQPFTAVCPHGIDAEWVATRSDSRSYAICRCPCPVRAEDAMVKGYRPHAITEPPTDATVSLYGPQDAGIVIPLPAEEIA